MSRQFEYETVRRYDYINGWPNDESEQDILDKMGLDGWELCGVVRSDAATAYYFKREKAGDE